MRSGNCAPAAAILADRYADEVDWAAETVREKLSTALADKCRTQRSSAPR